MTLGLDDPFKAIIPNATVSGNYATMVMGVLASASMAVVIYLFIDLLVGWYRDKRFQDRMRLRSQNESGGNLIKKLWRSFLPHLPRPPSFRGRIADGLFLLFQFFSRSAFIAGAIIGGLHHGLVGFGCGLVAGGSIGFWISRSLGLRGFDTTHGFFVRMAERGAGDPPGRLESLIETVRGERLAVVECRHIADAHAEAFRRLQSCDSAMELAQILDETDHNFLETVRRQNVKSGQVS